MKKLTKPILASAYLIISCVLILTYRSEINALKKENARLHLSLSKQIPQVENREPESLANDENQEELLNLIDEKQRLEAELDTLRAHLASSQKQEEILQDKIDEVLKPLEDENLLSSTLKTTVEKDNILVTGGYKDSEGFYQYSMVKHTPTKLEDGRSAIMVESTAVSLPPKVINGLGLDSLSTNANNTLQHGEIWTNDEFKKLLENISQIEGADHLSSPRMTLIEGKTGTIQVGKYQVNSTPKISGNGSDVDVELRVEQPSRW